MDARQANTPWIPREVLERIPVKWGLGEPNRKDKPGRDEEGWRWHDPSYKGNGVRIDEGNPNLSNETQREDHVVVRSGNPTLGRNGEAVPGTHKDYARDVRIPMREYRSWPHWNRHSHEIR